MIAEGQTLLFLDPWISIIPGACILIATLGFYLLGRWTARLSGPDVRRLERTRMALGLRSASMVPSQPKDKTTGDPQAGNN